MSRSVLANRHFLSIGSILLSLLLLCRWERHFFSIAAAIVSMLRKSRFRVRHAGRTALPRCPPLTFASE